MHGVPRGPIIVVGWFLFAASTVSPMRADGQAGSLLFRPATLTQRVDPVPSAPTAQPVPDPAPQPLPLAAPQPLPEPMPQPPATSQPKRSFPRVGATSLGFTQPLIQPQVTSQTRQALGFYGGYSARATLSQLPRRAPLQRTAPQPVRRRAKPFETIHREPTVSPYLNLHREEQEDESAPNYFVFVRPQMEQLDANRMQQREIQQLRGQLNSMSSTIAAPSYQATGTPGTGTAARYMDTAQFYGGGRR
jgi:hypothetical protein